MMDARACVRIGPGMWFSSSSRIAVSSIRLARFCKTSCRTTYADKEKRKKVKAEVLKSKGVGFEEIAKELGTDLETLKGWLD